MADTKKVAEGEAPTGGEEPQQPDFEQIAARIIDRAQGNGTAAVIQLVRDNHKARSRARKYETKLTEVEGKLSNYVALGSVDEIKAKLDKAAELEAQVAAQKEQDTYRTAAEAAGFKVTVLTDIAKARGLSIEIEDGEPFVVQGETRTGLVEYAEANLTDHLPALRVQGDAAEGQPKPRRWVEQKPGSGKPASTGASAAGKVLRRFAPPTAK